MDGWSRSIPDTIVLVIIKIWTEWMVIVQTFEQSNAFEKLFFIAVPDNMDEKSLIYCNTIDGVLLTS